ncbi:glycosyltransferase family 9 protein [Pantoea sp. 1.19]|uniref:glycosyltransferase family 9 protein n=1 Tax=Pantoea sp. 1.19 TaxID=1925589 RepID=UPI000948D357|nr:glycosyltransferase family 9 protein [Pantoea sp. 1.19]
MKILLIRRDNIGDLILTTPLIASLAQAYNAPVDLLVNSYNQAVLHGNPDVGQLHLYSKLHHRQPGQSALSVLWQRLKTILALRRARYDVAIIAREQWDKRPLQWAKLAGARRIIALGEQMPAAITDPVSPGREPEHIVQRLARLTAPLGLPETPPGPLALYLGDDEIAAMRQRLALKEGLPVYGLQISARKAPQRWQVEKFAELARRLVQQEHCQLLLFWSPGDANNPRHPGDDDKAAELLAACAGLPIAPVVTHQLRELMAAMSFCDQILTSDGGALHVAAGVGVPTVALFGNSEAHFWGPWQVPHRVVEGPTRDVRLLSVEAVLEAFNALRQQVLQQAGVAIPA